MLKETQASNSQRQIQLPFTITKPVTTRETSKVVESRDAELPFLAVLEAGFGPCHSGILNEVTSVLNPDRALIERYVGDCIRGL